MLSLPKNSHWHNYTGSDNMKVYTKILGNIADKEWQEAALDAEIEHIYLDQWTAQKSRFVAHSDLKNEFAVALGRNTRVKDGDILEYDADRRHIVIIKLLLCDVMQIDLSSLLKAEPDDIIHTAVELGHALGNQHWPAIVKGCKVYVPLTVDRKVMESVMRTHAFEGITFTFESAAQITPFLSPHEVRRLMGGTEPECGHTHHQH